jgi:ribosome recycling factor
MQKIVDHLREVYQGIRDGRGSPSLIENIRITCYGSQQPLQHLACISVGPDCLVVQPYDASIIPDINKAIYASGIGLTPQAAKTSIRLSIPQLDAEQRQRLAKYANQLAEEQRIAIRNVRRNLRKHGMSDDEANRLARKYIGKIDTMLESKLREIG